MFTLYNCMEPSASPAIHPPSPLELKDPLSLNSGLSGASLDLVLAVGCMAGGTVGLCNILTRGLQWTPNKGKRLKSDMSCKNLVLVVSLAGPVQVISSIGRVERPAVGGY